MSLEPSLELEVERRAQHRTAGALENLPEQLADSVERALRRVLADESLREAFWQQGYKEFEKHAGTTMAQWLGRRIINVLLTAAVAGALAWLVMTGRVDR